MLSTFFVCVCIFSEYLLWNEELPHFNQLFWWIWNSIYFSWMWMWIYQVFLIVEWNVNFNWKLKLVNIIIRSKCFSALFLFVLLDISSKWYFHCIKIKIVLSISINVLQNCMCNCHRNRNFAASSILLSSHHYVSYINYFRRYSLHSDISIKLNNRHFISPHTQMHPFHQFYIINICALSREQVA